MSKPRVSSGKRRIAEKRREENSRCETAIVEIDERAVTSIAFASERIRNRADYHPGVSINLDNGIRR